MFLESERSQNGRCQRAAPEYSLLEVLWLGSVHIIELPAEIKVTFVCYQRITGLTKHNDREKMN
jgi:hypothetical protein